MRMRIDPPPHVSVSISTSNNVGQSVTYIVSFKTVSSILASVTKLRLAFWAQRRTSSAVVAMLGLFSLGTTGASRALPAVKDHGAVDFKVAEGRNLNFFTRQGAVAAHLVLRSGRDLRILTAFPAGDSGVGLWFVPLAHPAQWRLASDPHPITLADAKGRPMYGIATNLTVDAARLQPSQALLSSVRVLRDYQSAGTLPKSVLIAPTVSSNEITWARDRLDGKAGYRLSLLVIHGTLVNGAFVAGADGAIGLRIIAVTGETPLTPLGGDDLLKASAARDAKARRTLDFLSYREKFLAGSWRFDTYFGRDTLMSVRLLMPVLQPSAVEGGLTSVVARLSQDGEVAHEEAIGEFAVLAHMKADGVMSDAPLYDYGMIDSSYMLAPVAEAWLLDDPRGRRRAAAFLAGPSGRADVPGETVGAALVRNLRLVLRETHAFADAPVRSNLLAIKPGRNTGQWRDSDTGLGGGRYPFDVNAVFAPAALHAIDEMTRGGILNAYLTPADRQSFAQARRMADIWRAKAPEAFDVVVPVATARTAVADLAKRQGVPAAPALSSVRDQPVRFDALSLNADGTPVRVVNSDESFDLLFGRPDAARLDMEVTALMRPFPAGLMTGVGLLVANPVYATPQVQALFTPSAYHGEVVWSWQQALLAAGLERQRARTDLPAGLQAKLRAAQKALWAVITANQAVANSELWSWTFTGGRYHVAAFGAAAADADEANAAQLWSTVFLALKPPA